MHGKHELRRGTSAPRDVPVLVERALYDHVGLYLSHKPGRNIYPIEEFHRADLFSFAESKAFDFLTPENMAKLSNLTPTQVIPTHLRLRRTVRRVALSQCCLKLSLVEVMLW